jgi:hypothetical protein
MRGFTFATACAIALCIAACVPLVPAADALLISSSNDAYLECRIAPCAHVYRMPKQPQPGVTRVLVFGPTGCTGEVLR